MTNVQLSQPIAFRPMRSGFELFAVGNIDGRLRSK